MENSKIINSLVNEIEKIGKHQGWFTESTDENLLTGSVIANISQFGLIVHLISKLGIFKSLIKAFKRFFCKKKKFEEKNDCREAIMNIEKKNKKKKQKATNNQKQSQKISQIQGSNLNNQDLIESQQQSNFIQAQSFANTEQLSPQQSILNIIQEAQKFDENQNSAIQTLRMSEPALF